MAFGLNKIQTLAQLSGSANRNKGTNECNGTGKIVTAQSKFGGASFDGTTGGSIFVNNFPAVNLGGGSYTIEGWIMIPSATSGQKELFRSYNGVSASGGSITLRPQGGNVYDIEYSFEGENWNTNGLQSWTYGVWYHFAIVRYSTGPITNIFLNGTRRSNRTATHTYPLGSQSAGQLRINHGGNAVYLDEIRISTNSRYANAATMTVPTAAFTNDANTSLLLHMNGTDGSNLIPDDF